MSTKGATATLEGTGHEDFCYHLQQGRIPAGATVVVEYGSAHLPYDVGGDWSLFRGRSR
jgi:hypothetical protein